MLANTNRKAIRANDTLEYDLKRKADTAYLRKASAEETGIWLLMLFLLELIKYNTKCGIGDLNNSDLMAAYRYLENKTGLKENEKFDQKNINFVYTVFYALDQGPQPYSYYPPLPELQFIDSSQALAFARKALSSLVMTLKAQGASSLYNKENRAELKKHMLIRAIRSTVADHREERASGNGQVLATWLNHSLNYLNRGTSLEEKMPEFNKDLALTGLRFIIQTLNKHETFFQRHESYLLVGEYSQKARSAALILANEQAASLKHKGAKNLFDQPERLGPWILLSSFHAVEESYHYFPTELRQRRDRAIRYLEAKAQPLPDQLEGIDAEILTAIDEHIEDLGAYETELNDSWAGLPVKEAALRGARDLANKCRARGLRSFYEDSEALGSSALFEFSGHLSQRETMLSLWDLELIIGDLDGAKIKNRKGTEKPLTPLTLKRIDAALAKARRLWSHLSTLEQLDKVSETLDNQYRHWLHNSEGSGYDTRFSWKFKDYFYAESYKRNPLYRRHSLGSVSATLKSPDQIQLKLEGNALAVYRQTQDKRARSSFFASDLFCILRTVNGTVLSGKQVSTQNLYYSPEYSTYVDGNNYHCASQEAIQKQLRVFYDQRNAPKTVFVFVQNYARQVLEVERYSFTRRHSLNPGHMLNYKEHSNTLSADELRKATDWAMGIIDSKTLAEPHATLLKLLVEALAKNGCLEFLRAVECLRAYIYQRELRVNDHALIGLKEIIRQFTERSNKAYTVFGYSDSHREELIPEKTQNALSFAQSLCLSLEAAGAKNPYKEDNSFSRWLVLVKAIEFIKDRSAGGNYKSYSLCQFLLEYFKSVERKPEVLEEKGSEHIVVAGLDGIESYYQSMNTSWYWSDAKKKEVLEAIKEARGHFSMAPTFGPQCLALGLWFLQRHYDAPDCYLDSCHRALHSLLKSGVATSTQSRVDKQFALLALLGESHRLGVRVWKEEACLEDKLKYLVKAQAELMIQQLKAEPLVDFTNSPEKSARLNATRYLEFSIQRTGNRDSQLVLAARLVQAYTAIMNYEFPENHPFKLDKNKALAGLRIFKADMEKDRASLVSSKGHSDDELSEEKEINDTSDHLAIYDGIIKLVGGVIAKVEALEAESSPSVKNVKAMVQFGITTKIPYSVVKEVASSQTSDLIQRFSLSDR